MPETQVAKISKSLPHKVCIEGLETLQNTNIFESTDAYPPSPPPNFERLRAQDSEDRGDEGMGLRI